MNIRHLSALLCAAAIVSIAGCGGGGGNDSGCGEKSQSFAIEFEIKSFTLPIGKPATLQSVLTPESCRSSMKLNLSSGDFPTGMTLDNGNVVGTPTKAGTYKFQVGITSVDGYQPFITLFPPRSSQVTVNVVPVGGTL